MEDFNNLYRIFTKEDYKRYMISNHQRMYSNPNGIGRLNELWDELREGYNFIIGIGKGNIIFFSVNYFSKYMVGN